MRDRPRPPRAGRIPRVEHMRYTTARMGRIFVARVDHGEDFLGGIRELVMKEGISHAVMLFLGALREGSVVTGPVEPVIPPVPHFVKFRDGWEVVGIATVFPGEEGPVIHFHASVGRGERTLTGCLRLGAETYLVMEVVMFELAGFAARKNRDPGTGLVLPDFDG